MTTEQTTEQAGMTPGMTPGQIRAGYKTQRRDMATKTGRPIRRTTQPGVYLGKPLGRFVYAEAGRLMVTDLTLDPAAGPAGVVTVRDKAVPVSPRRPATPLTAEELVLMVAGAYVEHTDGVGQAQDSPISTDPVTPGAVMVADRLTLTAMRRMAEAAARQTDAPMEVRGTAKILGFRCGLPHSGFLPTLTAALAAAWWAPTGVGETSLLGWEDAFAITRRAPQDRLAYLLAAALDGPSHKQFVSALVSAERYGAMSAQYGGVRSSAKAFKQANAVQGAHAAILNSDPLLAEYNLIAGDVNLIKITSTSHDRFRAVVSEPFKLKPGTEVALFDPTQEVGSSTRVMLDAVSYDPGNGGLTAHFRRPSSRSRGWQLVAEAASGYRPLYGAAAPFLGGGGGGATSTGRWASTTFATEGEVNRPPARREVPVDVALAGAPATM